MKNVLQKYRMHSNLVKIAGAAVFAAAIGYSVILSEYADVSGFSKDYQMGRTKNSVSTVLAGVLAQKIYNKSNINITEQKKYFPDSRITGSASQDYIQTYMDLTFSHVCFTADEKTPGKLVGHVDKSEFDWDITQTGPNKYHVHRWGPKFDSDLELNVNNGLVAGKYLRPGPHFNWDINGTYDSKGNVNVKIRAPLTLGIDLVGKITKK